MKQNHETWLKSNQEMGSPLQAKPQVQGARSPPLIWPFPQPWGKVFADMEECRLCPHCSVPDWALGCVLTCAGDRKWENVFMLLRKKQPTPPPPQSMAAVSEAGCVGRRLHTHRMPKLPDEGWVTVPGRWMWGSPRRALAHLAHLQYFLHSGDPSCPCPVSWETLIA